MVFGPSLTELFYEGGAQERLAAVDRFSTWPPEVQGMPVAGDYLSPSLEIIAEIGATSIHAVGSSEILRDMASRMGIPFHTYSFDTLEDVMESSRRLEELYPEADLSDFRHQVEASLDSVRESLSGEPLRVMAVVYLEEDGAITLAGRGTFIADIIAGAGCVPVAPDAGSYPSVSVEGVLTMAPDRVIILAPGGDPETIMERWTANGLPSEGVTPLTGEHLLIPGSRLPLTVREMASCLN